MVLERRRFWFLRGQGHVYGVLMWSKGHVEGMIPADVAWPLLSYTSN
jgi:hypothetical protein